MKKFFYDKKIILIYIFTILVLLIGVTYALSSASSSLGLTTALIGIDGDAYGSPTFDSSNLDFKPILDTNVEENTDNVIKIDFSVGGADSYNNDNLIYDIALNGSDVNCNLFSPYIMESWIPFLKGTLTILLLLAVKWTIPILMPKHTTKLTYDIFVVMAVMTLVNIIIVYLLALNYPH